MEVKFADESIAKVCESEQNLRRYIRKKKTLHSPEDIWQALDALLAAPTAQDLPIIYKFHLLSHSLTGRAGIDIRALGQPGRGRWRMILRPVSDCGDINKKESIKEVIVEEVLDDYHKGKE